jgi:hypothetical protein
MGSFGTKEMVCKNHQLVCTIAIQGTRIPWSISPKWFWKRHLKFELKLEFELQDLNFSGNTIAIFRHCVVGKGFS